MTKIKPVLYGMQDKMYHGHPSMANLTVNWFPMDTKELYEQNLKTRASDLKKYNWIDQEITYKFNSAGFRCNEFSIENNIVFLGCSHTFGIGLPYEDVYAYKIADQLKLEYNNLGVAGGSQNSCFRVALYYLPKLKPKIVIYQIPDETRLELRQPCRPDDDSEPWDHFFITDPRKEYYKEFVRFRENFVLQHHRNLLAIKHLCYELNIKLIVLEQMDFDIDTRDWARDLAHYGRNSHMITANTLLEWINE